MTSPEHSRVPFCDRHPTYYHTIYLVVVAVVAVVVANPIRSNGAVVGVAVVVLCWKTSSSVASNRTRTPAAMSLSIVVLFPLSSLEATQKIVLMLHLLKVSTRHNHRNNSRSKIASLI
jgi:hypothetical protein